MERGGACTRLFVETRTTDRAKDRLVDGARMFLAASCRSKRGDLQVGSCVARVANFPAGDQTHHGQRACERKLRLWIDRGRERVGNDVADQSRRYETVDGESAEHWELRLARCLQR